MAFGCDEASVALEYGTVRVAAPHCSRFAHLCVRDTAQMVTKLSRRLVDWAILKTSAPLFLIPHPKQVLNNTEIKDLSKLLQDRDTTLPQQVPVLEVMLSLPDPHSKSVPQAQPEETFKNVALCDNPRSVSRS